MEIYQSLSHVIIKSEILSLTHLLQKASAAGYSLRFETANLDSNKHRNAGLGEGLVSQAKNLPLNNSWE